MTTRLLGLTSILLLLPLGLACGDKDDGDGDGDGDGGSGDGGEDCTLDLAPAGDVSSDPTCEAVVDRLVGMTMEWQWTGDADGADPTFNSVISVPVVGDVDGDGTPEVVFTATDPANLFGGGLLYIVDGATGQTELMLDQLDGAGISDTGGPALGDIDGDGVPEILVPTMSSTIVALHADGEIQFETAPQVDVLFVYTHLGVADFNGDGMAEVYGGGAIFGADGGFEEASEAGIGGVPNITVAADLDGDGVQELVVGNQAFDLEGNLLWDRSEDIEDGPTAIPDIAPAVADLDGDGKGEVVGSDYNGWTVYALDDDGSDLWGPIDLPGLGGGPPCIADFDGDGGPEIVVVGYKSLSMFDADGTILWSREVVDGGYATNGCSAFDLDDDGAYELLYADDIAFYVVDGSSGEALFTETGHAGASIAGYPVVVDVDGDGKTEIVLGSNQINDGSAWGGITVFRGYYDSWSPTRPVWNQNQFWGGNVDDDLGIPQQPDMAWDMDSNGFRVGVVGERGTPMASAANLVALASDTCVECNSGLVRFEVAVQVANQGAVDVTEPIGVGVYAVDDAGRRELVETHAITDGLAAGRSSDSFEVSGQFATAVGFTALEVQVGGNAVRQDLGLDQPIYLDCNDDDNIVVVTFGCEE